MTFLEHRRRLLERKRFFGLRVTSEGFATPSKRLLSVRETPPAASAMRKLLWKYHRNQSKGRRRFLPTQPKTKLFIDSTTSAIMKLELEDLLSRNAMLHIETSALAMVNAFIGSKNVLDLYAESFDTDFPRTKETNSKREEEVLLRRFNKASLLRRPEPHHQVDPTMQRRYQFIHSMNELQEYACTLIEPVKSWDDALSILSLVLKFQSETEPVSEETQLVLVESDAFDTSKSPFQLDNGQNSSLRIRLSNNVEVDNYIQRLRSIRLEESTPPGLRLSQQKWLEIANSAISVGEDVSKDTEKDPQKGLPLLLVHPVSQVDRDRIHCAMSEDAGSDTDIVAKTEDDTDSVQRYSFRTLRPYEWLNDEVIHYFLVTLQRRDVQLCREQQGRKRNHFFKSFFMTKLLDEGNVNPALDGKYCYNNVKRWSKKVPGKDIFNLSKIFFPINQANQHWTSAVVFMEEQKIQYYDSLGGSGKCYLQFLLKYLQDEHLDKRKCPMKSPELWTLVPCTADTPRQENGYDCGVFTCLFADWISIDRKLEKLSEKEMMLYRDHIALSILDGQAK